MKILAALASPLLLLAGFCGGVEVTRTPHEPPPRQAPGPVVPVHPESLSGWEEDRIYRQLGGGSRPERTVVKEVEYPPDHRPWGGKPGVLIIESVIAPDGRIARFQVLRGPRDEILDRALADALKEWRFVPAKLYGTPVAVYYTMTINVNTTQ
jgi:TonB family protein